MKIAIARKNADPWTRQTRNNDFNLNMSYISKNQKTFSGFSGHSL
jgi:hypothetical protein